MEKKTTRRERERKEDDREKKLLAHRSATGRANYLRAFCLHTRESFRICILSCLSLVECFCSHGGQFLRSTGVVLDNPNYLRWGLRWSWHGLLLESRQCDTEDPDLGWAIQALNSAPLVHCPPHSAPFTIIYYSTTTHDNAYTQHRYGFTQEIRTGYGSTIRLDGNTSYTGESCLSRTKSPPKARLLVSSMPTPCTNPDAPPQAVTRHSSFFFSCFLRADLYPSWVSTFSWAFWTVPILVC